MPILIPHFLFGKVNDLEWQKEFPEDMWNDLSPSDKEYFYNTCQVIKTSTEKNK
tara:strand:- start:477 stop:638 length:162 start_codon:yes stop_codon:yes gene_type:complete